MLVTFVSMACGCLTSCSDNDEPKHEPSPAEQYSGTYSGTYTLNVAGRFSYDTDIKCTVTEGENGTVSVTIPEYSLKGTMMGDMTLGELTVTGLVYDESKDGFFRSYGGEGLTQTMNGTTYPLNDPSSILVVKDENGNVTIENPFTLGKMPLPLTATFAGK